MAPTYVAALIEQVVALPISIFGTSFASQWSTATTLLSPPSTSTLARQRSLRSIRGDGGSHPSTTTVAHASASPALDPGDDMGMRFMQPLPASAANTPPLGAEACAVPPDGAGLMWDRMQQLQMQQERILQLLTALGQDVATLKQGSRPNAVES